MAMNEDLTRQFRGETGLKKMGWRWIGTRWIGMNAVLKKDELPLEVRKGDQN